MMALTEIAAAAIADQLTLLCEGVYATVYALGHEESAKRARKLAVAQTRPQRHAT
jgi:hypothetical protein